MLVEWQTIKSFVDSRDLSIQYIEFDNKYWLKACDSFFDIECMLLRVGGSEDVADFEGNYKANGNQRVGTNSGNYKVDELTKGMTITSSNWVTVWSKSGYGHLYAVWVDLSANNVLIKLESDSKVVVPSVNLSDVSVFNAYGQGVRLPIVNTGGNTFAFVPDVPVRYRSTITLQMKAAGAINKVLNYGYIGVVKE